MSLFCFLSRRRRRNRSPLSRLRPQLEPLEGLVLPCTITWSSGASGLWTAPGNWSPARVPDATDDVCISPASGVMITLNTPATVQTLTLGSGRLHGAGDLTVTGELTWTGGIMSGTGQTSAAGGMAISGNANKFLEDTRRLENQGTAVWTGFGEIFLGSGARLINAASGTIEARSDSFITEGNGAAPLFQNDGAFIKLNGTSDTGIEVPFTVSAGGTVEVRTGTLYISAPGTVAGLMTVATGAALNFDFGQHTLAADSSLDAAGTVIFSGGQSTMAGNYTVTGTTRISGGTAVFNTTATTRLGQLSSGFLAGTGSLIVGEAFTWTGGTMRDAGLTVIESTATLAISGANPKQLNQRTLTNLGTTTWTGTGLIDASNAAQLNNDGTFHANSDAVFQGSGATPVFQNNGALQREGAGTTNISLGVTFNNAAGATVQVSAGTLLLGSGTSAGMFTVDAGATLGFARGTHTLEEPSRALGEGTIAFQGANVTVGGTYEAPAETRVTGGLVTFSGLAPQVRNGLFLGGTVTGPSDLTIVANTGFTWSGGTWTGVGRTIVAPDGRLAISGAFAKLLDGRHLLNLGTISWTSFLSANNGVLWSNLTGGVVEAGTANFAYGGEGTPPTFRNTGTFRTLNGATTVFDTAVTFANYDDVEVLPGRLVLLGQFANFAGQTLNSGRYRIVGTFEFPNADVRTNRATLTLSGPNSRVVNQSDADALDNLQSNYGGFSLEAGRNFTVNTFQNRGNLGVGAGSTFSATGMVTWAGGTMSGGGVLAFNGGVTLNTKKALVLSGLGATFGGTSSWTAGRLYLSDAARLTISANATFNITFDATAEHLGGGEVLLVNNGTLRKTAGKGAATFAANISLTNSGTLGVDSGGLSLLGGLTNFNPADGTFAGGIYQLSGNLLFTGAAIVANQANITLTGPNAGITDEAFASAFRTLTSHATGRQLVLQNGATLTTSAARFTNNGQITVGGGCTLTAESELFNSGNSTTFTLASNAVVNAGAFSQQTGNVTLTINNGAALSAGAFTQLAGTVTLALGDLNAAVTVRGGTFNGRGTINGNVSLEAGTLAIPSSGALTINGDATQSGGTLTLNAGTTFNAASFTLTLGTATFNGGTVNAAVSVQGGTFNARGTINGGLTLAGGRVNVGGTGVGVLTVNGDYVQFGGILQFQVRGLEDNDVLNVAGTAFLGGTLEVRLLAGYVPVVGDPFLILNAGVVDGVFLDLQSPDGVPFAPDYTGTSVTLITQE